MKNSMGLVFGGLLVGIGLGWLVFAISHPHKCVVREIGSFC